MLNAARYGVPQDRRRLFLLGARKPLAPPLYPAPLTHPADAPPEIGVVAGPSCLEALDDPRLFSLEMSEAAAFWGIERPIQRRDRKSGARKRSQAETEAERLARSVR